MQTNPSRRAFLLGATAAGIGLVTPSFAIADTTEATNSEPRFSFSLSTIDSNGNAIPAANQFQNYSPEYSIIELGGIYRKEQRSNSRFLRKLEPNWGWVPYSPTGSTPVSQNGTRAAFEAWPAEMEGSTVLVEAIAEFQTLGLSAKTRQEFELGEPGLFSVKHPEIEGCGT